MVNASNKLKPCFCGKVPDCLDIVDTGQGTKWALAVPFCCGEWSIEFRTMYFDFKSDECMKLAVESWNDAPRGYLSLDEVIELLEAEPETISSSQSVRQGYVRCVRDKVALLKQKFSPIDHWEARDEPLD